MNLTRNSTTYNLLVAMLLSGGEITSDFTRLSSLTGVSERMLRWSADKLLSYHYIEEKKRGGEGRFRLKLFEKNKMQYLPKLWDGAEKYTPCLYAVNAQNAKRNLNLAEIILLMESAHVSVTPDNVPLPELGIEEARQNAGIPMFIIGRNVRSSFPVTDSRERMARYYGMFVTDNGVFPVYNHSRGNIEYTVNVEKGSVKTAEQIRQTYLPYTDNFVSYEYKHSPLAIDSRNKVITEGCLIIADDYTKFLSFFEPDKSYLYGKVKERKKLGMAALAYSYNSIIALPMISVVTASFINMFAAEMWHKRLTGLVLNDSQRIPDIARTTIDVDGIIDNEKIICFIDCDIRRLRNVIANANPDSTYRVVCYDFQVPLLKKILPYNFKMAPYSMDEVYTLYCENCQ